MNQPDRVELGPLQVSRLCLGTMLMGDKTPAAEAHRMLDAFVDAGHNFIDTADVYGDGAAEEVLEPWLARRRDDVVVTTKVRFPVSDPGGAGLAPERIRSACDASLRRMGIDEIDLYQVHAPDPDVELEDTLEALDGLVRAGKVRALGLSNFPAWLLAWAVRTQDCNGWAPFVALQAQYSLVERSAELDLLPCCRATGLGMMPWGPLGGGFFTGQHQRGSTPAPGSRLAEAPDDVEEALHRRATERELPRRRRGARRRCGVWRDGAAGRHRVAVAPAGGRLAGARPANRGAARGPLAGRFARPLPATAAPARQPHAAARDLPAPDARRAERDRRRAAARTAVPTPPLGLEAAT